jgi:hypothetical protein
VRARDVNPTPADLGGVTSFLYELEHCAKPSLPGCYISSAYAKNALGSLNFEN